MESYIVILERTENRIIWMHTWQEWPRIIPTTANLWSYKFTGKPLIGYEFLYNDYKLALSSNYTRMIIKDSLSENLIDKLSLLRSKCKASWNLLSYLHELQRSHQGLLPDICMGYGNKLEEQFSNEEYAKIKEMIGNDVSYHYPKIWQATSINELRNASREIVAKFRRSPAFC